MVAPHELKNKKFTNAMRGYSMAEVDDHIDFIIAQYTELYRQNADLEQRLMRMQEYISEIEGKETEINGALVDAQKAAARTLSEANEQAETVMLATKTNCDKIMAQFRYDVEEERAKLNSLRAAVREFKAAMFETYRTHIEFLEQIAPGEIEDDTEDYTRKVVGLIKEDIINSASEAQANADAIEAEAEAAPETEIQSAEELPSAEAMMEAAEEPIPEAAPAEIYAQPEAPVQEPEAPVQFAEPVQYEQAAPQEQSAQFAEPVQYEQAAPQEQSAQFAEPVQYEQFAEPAQEPIQYDEPAQIQPEAPATYEEVHNISYDEPAQVQVEEPQYAQPQYAPQPQFAGIPVADDEEDVFEEDAFDDIEPQAPIQQEQAQYYENAQAQPAYEAQPEPEEPAQNEPIYSRQSRPVSRMQNRAMPQQQRPFPQRAQAQRPMQQPMNTPTMNGQPMQSKQVPLGEQRSQVAPPQGRTRTNRASVKDAIRQLNQTFVTEDDDDDDIDAVQPQGRMNAQQPNGQMRPRR